MKMDSNNYREVHPVPYNPEEVDLEEARYQLQALKELRDSPGFDLIRALADGIAYDNYSRILANHEDNRTMVDYSRGQIGGLESLFQNLNSLIDDLEGYVKNMEKKMETEGVNNGN